MAVPVSPAEFAAAMDRLGPWDPARRVAVAVSGGPDSLALALLARQWGDAVAFVVDHGLRAESAAEATAAQAILMAQGIAASILPLQGLQSGPSIAERARAARYAALSAACRAAGLVDLLLGHHAGDQAETVLLRRRSGSGPGGLAGMAAVTERTDVRLLRPLLRFAPGRLAAVVAAAGLTAATDPTNTDLRTTRARLRREIADDRGPLLAEARARGAARAERDAGLARELAERVQFSPAGFALVSPGPMAPDALAAVLRTVSGRHYPVSAKSVAALVMPGLDPGIHVVRLMTSDAPSPHPEFHTKSRWCPDAVDGRIKPGHDDANGPASSAGGRGRSAGSVLLRSATIAGVRILPAGRLGEGWLVVREEAALADPAPAVPGLLWDGRFRLVCAPPETTIGALGSDAARLRHLSPWPAAVLRVLPALRRHGVLSEVPHIVYTSVYDEGCASGCAVVHSAAAPAAAAAFVAC